MEPFIIKITVPQTFRKNKKIVETLIKKFH